MVKPIGLNKTGPYKKVDKTSLQKEFMVHISVLPIFPIINAVSDLTLYGDSQKFNDNVSTRKEQLEVSPSRTGMRKDSSQRYQIRLDQI